MSEKREYEDKLPEGDIVERSKFVRWLDNFWYHYKWHVIIVTFFVTVIAICTVQMLTRERYDTTVTYSGPYRMSNEERAEFERLMDSLCPEDYDGNGERNVQYVIYQIYSESEIMAEKESVEAAGGQYQMNTQYNQSEYNGFNTYVLSGECSVYMVSPYLYGILRDGGRLKDLSAVLGDGLPVGVDGYGFGVRLGDTEFYKYNPAVQMLPPDTVICLLAPTVAGSSSNPEQYDVSVGLFRAIVEFKVAE
ncbi:MAG: hypothetical protein E7589_06650 [Ruminococcaceae bacterium]|nr:hypothetical protein [Oscillospiraceae bacterium]